MVTKSNVYGDRNSIGDLTLANVVVGASDNYILVLTSVQDSNHANYPVVSMTRDGQSFTKIQHYEPAGNVRVEAWILKSPNVGTASIVIDVTGLVGEFTATAYVGGGADTDTQPNDYDGGSGNGFAPAVSIDTTVDDGYLFHILCAEATITGVGADQNSDALHTDQSYENAQASSKAAGVAGTKSMSASMASGQPYAQIAVAVKAAVVEAATPKTLTTLNVGS